MLTVFIVWLLDAAHDAVAYNIIEAEDSLAAIITAENWAELDGTNYEWTTVEKATATEAAEYHAEKTSTEHVF